MLNSYLYLLITTYTLEEACLKTIRNDATDAHVTTQLALDARGSKGLQVCSLGLAIPISKKSCVPIGTPIIKLGVLLTYSYSRFFRSHKAKPYRQKLSLYSCLRYNLSFRIRLLLL